MCVNLHRHPSQDKSKDVPKVTLPKEEKSLMEKYEDHLENIMTNHMDQFNSDREKAYANELKRTFATVFAGKKYRGKYFFDLSDEEIVWFVADIQKTGYLVTSEGGELMLPQIKQEGNTTSATLEFTPIKIRVYKELVGGE